MARECTICTHPLVTEIDKAIQRGWGLTQIEKSFHNVSARSISRHRAHLVPDKVGATRRGRPPAAQRLRLRGELNGQSSMEGLASLLNETYKNLERAQRNGQLLLALKAIDTGRGIIATAVDCAAKMAATRSISFEEFKRTVEEMARIVHATVSNPDEVEAIERGWSTLDVRTVAEERESRPAAAG
jgi:hypothetical protein